MAQRIVGRGERQARVVAEETGIVRQAHEEGALALQQLSNGSPPEDGRHPDNFCPCPQSLGDLPGELDIIAWLL